MDWIELPPGITLNAEGKPHCCRILFEGDDGDSLTLIWPTSGEDLRVVAVEQSSTGARILVYRDMVEADAQLQGLDMDLEEGVEYERAYQRALTRRVRFAAAA